MKFKRFAQQNFLRQIGRPLLARFFDRFAQDLAAVGALMPDARSDDSTFFAVLAVLAMAPDKLPGNLVEALLAIEELANPQGQERLERAVAESGIDLEFEPESSHADIALQVWLAAPELAARKHQELRLSRLSSFQYFGGAGEGPCAGPDEAALARMQAELDAWFVRHNRGRRTAHVEPVTLDGEMWFLVRHGDTYTRTAKVREREVELLHYRPAKDDVVVYSPEQDELRIHAGTKGEKELYRQVFGRGLKGDAEYFSRKKTYTLEPLRREGADALDTAGVEGIFRVALCELEVAWDNGFNETLTRKADDLYAAVEDRAEAMDSIPPGARIARAGFEFYFADSRKPRKAQVRPPNLLRLGRHGDARLVQLWLARKGFRVAEEPPALGLQRAGGS